jgi:phosphopantothenoylcysteine decarboxylase / phosphopantothenate---cysteine ligase
VGPVSARRLSPPWEGRRVLLGVTGGIACYKSIALARELTLRGAVVDVVLTPSAEAFLRPLVFEGVTGRPVLGSLWSTDGAARHLSLAAAADVVVVAPATADLLARLREGRADDLLTTLILATRAPVLLAPAMNDRMWAHPVTLASAQALAERGLHLIGPAIGPLAVGEGEGPGRMEEPEVLVEWVGRALSHSAGAVNPSGVNPWAGRRVLVTAGPTREPLDPVRYLGNRSSGKMGIALARAAWLRGATVDLILGPGTVPAPSGVAVHRVETAIEMWNALQSVIPHTEFNILAAAVADFRPTSVPESKVKRGTLHGSWALSLEENPDLARESIPHRHPESQTLGFALETDALIQNARLKLASKGFDWIVGNAAAAGVGFESDMNEGVFIDREAPEEAVSLPREPKDAMAWRILDLVEPRLRHGVPLEEGAQ